MKLYPILGTMKNKLLVFEPNIDHLKERNVTKYENENTPNETEFLPSSIMDELIGTMAQRDLP